MVGQDTTMQWSGPNSTDTTHVVGFNTVFAESLSEKGKKIKNENGILLFAGVELMVFFSISVVASKKDASVPKKKKKKKDGCFVSNGCEINVSQSKAVPLLCSA